MGSPNYAWTNDDDFKSLSDAEKVLVYRDFFDQEIADDDIRQLSPDGQKMVFNDFLSDQGISQATTTTATPTSTPQQSSALKASPDYAPIPVAEPTPVGDNGAIGGDRFAYKLSLDGSPEVDLPFTDEERSSMVKGENQDAIFKAAMIRLSESHPELKPAIEKELLEIGGIAPKQAIPVSDGPNYAPIPNIPKQTVPVDQGFGKRADGTEKGDGFLGVLKRPDGKVSTELSIGVNLNGKEIEIPTLVPTLTKDEVDYLLNFQPGEGKQIPRPIIDKAVAHAKKRIAEGKSPFADPEDKITGIPKPTDFLKNIRDRMQQIKDEGDGYSGMPDSFSKVTQAETKKDSLGAFGQAALSLPENLLAKGIMLAQGQKGASVADRGPLDLFVKRVEDRNRQRALEYKDSGNFIPGLISNQDVVEAGPNFAFSGASMAGSLAGGLAAVPIPIPGARIAGALAGGSAAAYRMDGYMAMQSWLEKENEKSIAEGKGPITKEQEDKFKKEFSDLASKHALWEAGPEGVGNVLEIALATAKRIPGIQWMPKKLVGKAVKEVLRGMGILGTELATEAQTQIGQTNVEIEAGMSDEKPREFTNIDDQMKSVKEVLPQVLLLTGGMSAGGAVYRNLKNKGTVKQEVGPQDTTQQPTGEIVTGPQALPDQMDVVPVDHTDTINSVRQMLESGEASVTDLEESLTDPEQDPELVKAVMPVLLEYKNKAENPPPQGPPQISPPELPPQSSVPEISAPPELKALPMAELKMLAEKEGVDIKLLPAPRSKPKLIAAIEEQRLLGQGEESVMPLAKQPTINEKEKPISEAATENKGATEVSGVASPEITEIRPKTKKGTYASKKTADAAIKRAGKEGVYEAVEVGKGQWVGRPKAVGEEVVKPDTPVVKTPVPEDNLDLAELGNMDRLSAVRERFPDLNAGDALKLSRKIRETATGSIGVAPKGEKIGIHKDLQDYYDKEEKRKTKTSAAKPEIKKDTKDLRNEEKKVAKKSFPETASFNPTLGEQKKDLIAQVDSAIKAAPSENAISFEDTDKIIVKWKKRTASKVAYAEPMIYGEHLYTINREDLDQAKKEGAEVTQKVTTKTHPEAFITFTDKAGAKFSVQNNKKSLQTFKKSVEKMTVKTPNVKRYSKPSATNAGKKESIGENDPGLMKITGAKGWVTDGVILIKNEELSKKSKKDGPEWNRVSSVLESKTKPAKLAYYGVEGVEVETGGSKGNKWSRDIETIGASEVPIVSTKENPAFAVFETEDRHVSYVQEKFNVIRNRFPNATYSITDDGVLHVESKGEKVAVLMPFRKETAPAHAMAKEAGLVRFSRSTVPKPRGITRKLANSVIKALWSEAKGFTGEVHVMDSAKDLTPDQLQRFGINPFTDVVRGIFDPTSGDIYLFLDGMDSKRDAVRAFVEELMHSGISKVVPDSVLLKVYDSVKDTKEMIHLAKRYNWLDAKTEEGQIGLVDEYLAKSIRDNTLPERIWQQIVRAVRMVMRKIHLAKRFTNNEIRAMVRNSVMKGSTATIPGVKSDINEFAQPAKKSLSQAIKSILDNKNFVKWFDGSKVVKNGEPLVVYHGTYGDFSVFNSSEGDHLGFHFGSKDAAHERAEDTKDEKFGTNDFYKQTNKIMKAKDRLAKNIRSSAELPDDHQQQLLEALESNNDVEISRLLNMSNGKATEAQQRALNTLEKQWRLYSDARMAAIKYGKKASVMPVYLSIKKPFRMKDVGAWDSIKAINEELGEDYESLLDFMDDLESKGYDGIVYKNLVEDRIMERDSYIAFRPTQIKSIYNSGEFDLTNPDIRKMVAHHGTPHIWEPEPGFPNGRPRIDKIGTGEGGAAYGHGIYFAEKEILAKHYFEILTRDKKRDGTFEGTALLNDFLLETSKAETDVDKVLINKIFKEFDFVEQLKKDKNRMGIFSNLNKVLVSQLNNVRSKYTSYPSGSGGWGIPHRGLSEYGKKIWKELQRFDAWDDAENIAYEYEDAVEGSLYKLDIPDSEIPKLLDWDKPLSEQTDYVKKVVKSSKWHRDAISSRTKKEMIGGLFRYADPNKQSGGEIYEDIAFRMFDDDIKATSEYLSSIGIPGNTHGGVSKGGTGAKYVIWDQAVLDKIVLLKRNQKALKAVQKEQPAEWARFSYAGEKTDRIRKSVYSYDEPIRNQRERRRAEEAGGLEYADHIHKAMDLPEIVWLTKELMNGKYPQVVTRLASRMGKPVNSKFTHTKGGRIKIAADIFKDQYAAKKELAKALGHLSDWLPDQDLARGNIFGRIATLHNFLKRTLPKSENIDPKLSEADRIRLREEAARGLTSEKTVDEEVAQELPITPSQVMAIWNSVEGSVNNDLLDYMKRLNTAEKKRIIKEAMKGQVASELRRFSTIVKIKTGKKIKIKLTPTEEQIRNKYEKLVREEIDKRKLFTLSEVVDELKKFTRLWNPFDPSENPEYTKYRYSSKELYADAFSAIIIAPGYAQEQIPQFMEGFFNYLDRKPELKKMYDEIQDTIKNHGTLEAISNRVREGMRRGSDDWIEQIEKQKKKIFEKDYWGNTFLGTDFAILRRVKKARNLSNILYDPFNESLDPTNPIDDARYTATEANGYIKDMFTKVVKGYEAIGMSDLDFSEYLFYRRIVGEKTEYQAWSEGVTKKEATPKKAEMENRFGPKLKEVADAFSAVRKEWILDKLKDGNKYASDDLIKYIEENIDSYATISIYEHMEKKGGVASTAGLFSSPIKSRKGSLKSTRPMFSVTLENDMAIINAVNKSIAAKSVADFMTEYGEDGDIEDADVAWDGKRRVIQPPADTNNYGLIVYMHKGKMVGKYVPKYVAEFFNANPVQSMLITKMFRWTATPFKAIFTGRNPGFWLFNIIRDYHRATRTLSGKMSYITFSKYMFKNIKKAATSAFNKEMTDAERQMMHDKSLLSVMNYHGDESHDAMTERILSRYGLIEPKNNNKIKKATRKFFHILDGIGMMSERVTKFAANDYLKTNYPDISDQERAAIVRRTGSPSFLTQGTATPLLNNILIFSNPMIQGYREDINFAKNKPIETLFKIGAIVMMPKVLMMAAAAGLFDDDDKDEGGLREVYARISEYDKANYICIPYGVTPNGKVAYIRLPQDELSRVIGGTLWKMFSSEKGKYLQNIEDYTGGQIPSVSPLWELLDGIKEYRAGRNIYDSFRSREVFSDQLMSAAKVEGSVAEKEKREKMLGWVWNTAGGGMFYKFPSNDIKSIKTTTEKLVGYPILSNIIGRFVKVSDYGVRETIKKEKEKVRSESDLQSMMAYDAIQKNMEGKPVSEEELTALFIKYKSMPRIYQKLTASMYENVYIQEVINARSDDEIEEVAKLAAKDPFARRFPSGDEAKSIELVPWFR